MKARFRKFRRDGVYYSHDNVTGKQASLHTRDKDEALVILDAKNEAYRQPSLNLQIARNYMFARDELYATRTWG